MKNLATWLWFAAGALLAGQVGATVVNVNFDSAIRVNPAVSGPGLGPIDYTGTIWNNTAPLGGSAYTTRMTALLDSEGNATGMDLKIGSNGSWNWNNANGNLSVLGDYIYANVRSDFTLSGLVAGGSYDLAFLGQGDRLDQGPRITIGAMEKTIDSVDLNAIEWTEYENYVLFRDVEADDSGEITGTYGQSDNGVAVGLGGMQIEWIPEPATLGLMLGVFSLAAAVARRRV